MLPVAPAWTWRGITTCWRRTHKPSEGWKLKKDGKCLTFARKKYQIYPPRIFQTAWFGFVCCIILLVGFFFSKVETGFLNHPGHTNNQGHHTIQYPNKYESTGQLLLPTEWINPLFFNNDQPCCLQSTGRSRAGSG